MVNGEIPAGEGLLDLDDVLGERGENAAAEEEGRGVKGVGRDGKVGIDED